ncbi:MAG: hypothetical protein ACREBU_06970 [Nitrososphaera sp.]
MTDFIDYDIDYDSQEFKTWLERLPAADQKLVLPAPLDELGALSDEELQRSAELRKQFRKQHLQNVVKEYKYQPTQRLAGGDGKAESTKPKEVIVLTDDLKKEVSLSEIAKILGTSIKRDDAAKQITFLAMLLAQTANDQVNIGFQSESASGKTYIALELRWYFPKEEVITLAAASPTAFYHERSEFNKERGVNIVDFEGKILILLEQPHFTLLERMRSFLSHDEKELTFKITDRSQKSGLRAKTVILKGYATVIFCTAKMNPDEQEKTRLILLSASTDQEKLRQSLLLTSSRKSNSAEYEKLMSRNPDRIWLKNRVQAIRDRGIKEIVIPNHEKAVYERFIREHPYLQARHNRDFPRIISFIKSHALLNCFNRKCDGDTIEASQQDIDAGFMLYKQISESNEVGLSPYIFKVYSKVIEPLLDPKIGVSKKEILSHYHAVFHATLSPKTLDDILSQIQAAGLTEERPDDNDKRRTLFYPTVTGDISASDLLAYLNKT